MLHQQLVEQLQLVENALMDRYQLTDNKYVTAHFKALDTVITKSLEIVSMETLVPVENLKLLFGVHALLTKRTNYHVGDRT